MYSAEDFIEMRKNANRGMWLSLAIVVPVIGLGICLVLWAFQDETQQAFSIVELWFPLLICAGMTIGCLVKAYFKEPFELASNGSGDVGGVGIGDAGGD